MVGVGADRGLVCESIRSKKGRRRKPLVDFLLNLSAHRKQQPRASQVDSPQPPTFNIQQQLQLLLQREQSPPLQNLTDEDLQTLCNDGKLDTALHALSHMPTVPSHNTYLSLLQACTKKKSLTHAKHVHDHLARHNLELTTFLGDYVATTLAKCGGLDDGLQLFHRLPRRTVFSWTTMISMLADCGRGHEALKMHANMQEDGVEPNQYTYVSLLKACGTIPDLEEGKKIHADVRTKGFACNVFVGSTLVSMYGKCGSIVEAENVFSELPERNVVSWNAMLTAYVEQGQGGKALLLYRQMQEQGVSQDQGTFVLAFQACRNLAEKGEGFVEERQPTKVAALSIGQALHADAWRNGFSLDVFIGSALVIMYGKCRTMADAENVFGGLPRYDKALWNAMLLAYIEHGEGGKSLWLYRQMQEEGVSPDQQTFAIVLYACGAIADKEEAVVVKGHLTKPVSLIISQALHADFQMKGFAVDGVFCNILLSMYGKCGAVVEAEKVFFGLSQRDVVSWNTMLSAYVEHGHGDKALHYYKEMQKEQVTLDEVTLTCLLQASNETGSMETCWKIHFIIICAGYDMDTLLATTLIHAYGGCASMENAESVFDGLPQPDILSWTACIAGYAQDVNYVSTFQAFDEMQVTGIKPDGVALIPVLSSCSHAGLVEEGINYFEYISRDYGLTPNLKHYASMVDLLGRAGDFIKVKIIFGRMPMQADLAVWSCLLSACRTHGNVELEKQAFNYAMDLQPRSLQGMPNI